MIQQAMKEDIHFAVNPTRNAKQQALEVVRKLKVHVRHISHHIIMYKCISSDVC